MVRYGLVQLAVLRIHLPSASCSTSMMKGAVSVLAWNMCYHRDKVVMGNRGKMEICKEAYVIFDSPLLPSVCYKIRLRLHCKRSG